MNVNELRKYLDDYERDDWGKEEQEVYGDFGLIPVRIDVYSKGKRVRMDEGIPIKYEGIGDSKIFHSPSLGFVIEPKEGGYFE